VRNAAVPVAREYALSPGTGNLLHGNKRRLPGPDEEEEGAANGQAKRRRFQ
jgi:hypothetical protein